MPRPVATRRRVGRPAPAAAVPAPAAEALEPRTLLAVSLVGDLNANPSGRRASNLVDVGSAVFFANFDSSAGTELWKSDGTSAGTARLKDLYPGIASSRPSNLTAVGDTLFFTATDADGAALWRSDGTADGTTKVRGSLTVWGLRAAGQTVFIAGSSGATEGLWKSDGTPAGTVLVKPGRPWEYNYGMTLGDRFFYTISTPAGLELWETSGGEPTMVKLLSNGYRYADEKSLVVGNRLYFTTTDYRNTNLWVTDGTPDGTTLVRRFDPGTLNSVNIVALASSGGAVWVRTNHIQYNAGLGVASPTYSLHHAEVWRTDGTPGGTRRVADAGPAGEGLAVVGATAYFTARTLGNENPFERPVYQLWKSDGVSPPVLLLSATNDDGFGGGFEALAEAGGRLYFSGSRFNRDDYELWTSDGTPAGTVRVKDLAPGPGVGSSPRDIRKVGGLLYFTTNNPTSVARSDGTEAGTFRLATTSDGTLSSDPRDLLSAGGALYFRASRAYGRDGVYRTDGTAAGTTLLADIPPGGSYDQRLLSGAVGATVYFRRPGSSQGPEELWKTDGTPAGTAPVKAMRVLSNVVDAAGRAAFIGSDVPVGQALIPALWLSDGTPAGTAAVTPVVARSDLFATRAGRVFFAAEDAGGVEPWTSDGTAAGTVRLSDVKPGGAGSNPRQFVEHGGFVYFTADDGASGEELWRTDGTAARTTRVADLLPGPLGSGPVGLSAVGGALLFTTTRGEAPQELWRSDGTPQGTTRIASVPGPSAPTPLQKLTAVGDTLFFTAQDPTYGHELWKSDGTPAGTVRVTDLAPGPGSVEIARLAAFNGTLAFATYESGGSGLYRSDGTPEGTFRVAMPMYAAAMPTGGWPERLVPVGNTLFFAVGSWSFGSELWKLTTEVEGRHVVYPPATNGGATSPAQVADVAADKVALLPGGAAGARNYTTFSRGVTGVVIDLSDLPPGNLSAADFTFRAGGIADPESWTSAPPPTAVTVHRGAGAGRTDRVSLSWPAGALRNTWLQVTVHATPNTGLAAPDVFYFGNLAGDTGGAGAPRVDVFDLARTRAAVGRTTAAALNTFDFNRDGRINALDVGIVRANQRRSLALFTAPAAPSAAAAGRAFDVIPPSSRAAPRPARRSAWDEIAAEM